MYTSLCFKSSLSIKQPTQSNRSSLTPTLLDDKKKRIVAAAVLHCLFFSSSHSFGVHHNKVSFYFLAELRRVLIFCWPVSCGVMLPFVCRSPSSLAAKRKEEVDAKRDGDETWQNDLTHTLKKFGLKTSYKRKNLCDTQSNTSIATV